MKEEQMEEYAVMKEYNQSDEMKKDGNDVDDEVIQMPFNYYSEYFSEEEERERYNTSLCRVHYTSFITQADILSQFPSVPPHTTTHSLLVIPSSSPLSSPPSLFSLIHDPSIRSQHDIRVWALEIGVSVCNILSSLLHTLYGRDDSSSSSSSSSISTSISTPPPQYNLDDLKWMLLNINPYTLFYLSANEIGLAKLSPEMAVPLLPLCEGRENALGEEKKRWLCGGVYEENCVHALSLILWEMLTDCVPFSDNTPDRVGKIVCEGGVPDIEVLNGMDERLCQIINECVMGNGNGRRKMGMDEMESILREYREEVIGGEREMDETLPPDTAEIVIEDSSVEDDV